MLAHAFFPLEVRIAAEVRAAVDAGFEVDVQRTLVRDGREPRVETFHSRYAATGAVVCLRARR